MSAQETPPFTPLAEQGETPFLGLVEVAGPDGSFFNPPTPAEQALALAENCHKTLNDKGLSRSARVAHITREIIHRYSDILGAKPQIDDLEIKQLAVIAEALFSRAKTDTELASELAVTEEGLEPFESLSPIQLARTLAEGYTLFDECKIALLATQLWVLERAMDPDARDQIIPSGLIKRIHELKIVQKNKRPAHGFNSPVY